MSKSIPIPEFAAALELLGIKCLYFARFGNSFEELEPFYRVGTFDTLDIRYDELSEYFQYIDNIFIIKNARRLERQVRKAIKNKGIIPVIGHDCYSSQFDPDIILETIREVIRLKYPGRLLLEVSRFGGDRDWKKDSKIKRLIFKRAMRIIKASAIYAKTGISDDDKNTKRNTIICQGVNLTKFQERLKLYYNYICIDEYSYSFGLLMKSLIANMTNEIPEKINELDYEHLIYLHVKDMIKF